MLSKFLKILTRYVNRQNAIKETEARSLHEEIKAKFRDAGLDDRISELERGFEEAVNRIKSEE